MCTTRSAMKNYDTMKQEEFIEVEKSVLHISHQLLTYHYLLFFLKITPNNSQ